MSLIHSIFDFNIPPLRSVALELAPILLLVLTVSSCVPEIVGLPKPTATVTVAVLPAQTPTKQKEETQQLVALKSPSSTQTPTSTSFALFPAREWKAFEELAMVRDAAVDPDGKLIFVANHFGGQFLLWDLTTWSQDAFWEYWDLPTSVAISPSLGLIAAGHKSVGPGDQTYIEVWDTDNQNMITTITGHGLVSALEFSPVGTRLVSADGDISLYDPLTGTLIGQLDLDPTLRPALDVAYSPDGSLLTVGHWNGSVTTWDANSRIQITHQQAFAGGSLSDRPVYSIAFSSDGNEIAAGSPDSIDIALISPLANTTPTLIQVDHSVYSLAFSPDGDMLAVGGDYEITVLDALGHTHFCRLVTDAPTIVGLAFTSDNLSVVSVSMGGTISQWLLSDACGVHEN